MKQGRVPWGVENSTSKEDWPWPRGSQIHSDPLSPAVGWWWVEGKTGWKAGNGEFVFFKSFL